MSNKKPSYHLVGYDKDNDIYETLCSGDNLDYMLQIATALTIHHRDKNPIRYKREPFDWFLLQDGNGDDLYLFTEQCVYGKEVKPS